MDLPFIGWHGVITIFVYALTILGVTLYLATRGVSRKSLSGFYLAGKGLGPLLLFFTLFATQYSGNTVIGYPASAYRIGFAWWQSVPYMVLVYRRVSAVCAQAIRSLKEVRICDAF